MTKPSLKTDLNPDLLPPFARELAEDIGLKPLLTLVEARGGLSLYVPARVTADHHLSRLIGHKAAQALSEKHRNNTITIPNCATSVRALLHQQIAERRNSGESEAEVAADVGMWGRSIRRINAKHKKPEDDKQGKLL